MNVGPYFRIQSPIFGNAPKRGLNNNFSAFFLDLQKLNLKILNLAYWSIGTNMFFVVVVTHNFFLNTKRGFEGSLRSDFAKTIDQSNVNGFSYR